MEKRRFQCCRQNLTELSIILGSSGVSTSSRCIVMVFNPRSAFSVQCRSARSLSSCPSRRRVLYMSAPPDIRVSRAVPCGGTHCWALLQLALLDSSLAARLSANKSSFACCVWRAASRNFQMLPTSPLLHEASLPLLRGIPLSVHPLDTSHEDDPRCHTEDNLLSRLSVVPLDTTLVTRRRTCQCGARFLAITHMVPSLKDQ